MTRLIGDETVNDALSIWRKRLEFLECERAKAATADQRFSIDEQISEAKAKITELEDRAAERTANESPMIRDLTAAITEKKFRESAFAGIVLEGLREHPNLRPSSDYDFDKLASAIRSADAQLSEANSEYPGPSWRNMFHETAADLFTAICVLFANSTDKHKLGLHACNWIYQQADIQIRLESEESQSAYESGCRGDSDAVFDYLKDKDIEQGGESTT